MSITGTPLETETRLIKAENPFSFTTNELNPSPSVLAGVKLQADTDTKFCYGNNPKEGYLLPASELLFLSANEARKFRIINAKDKDDYKIVYTVYIK